MIDETKQNNKLLWCEQQILRLNKDNEHFNVELSELDRRTKNYTYFNVLVKRGCSEFLREKINDFLPKELCKFIYDKGFNDGLNKGLEQNETI